MDPFMAEICLFGGNFAPRGWAFCNGQLLAISQYQALFSLLGTTYGGDGRTSFALPDLRGRAPIHPGTGPGLSTYRLGERGGAERIQLTAQNLPQAPVNIPATSGDATTEEPENAVMAVTDALSYAPPTTGSAKRVMAVGTLGGGNQPYSNLQPFLGLNYIIALVGTFPSRN